MEAPNLIGHLPPERPVTDGRADPLLVEAVRAGDVDAFGELVTRYERRLVQTLHRLVGDWESARDLAQETFLRAYQRLTDFDASRRFAPWLFRIGVNLAVDQWRRASRLRPSRLSDDAVADPRADQTQQHETSEEVRKILEMLPAKHRTVLTLRDLEGFPCSEIAAIMNRRETTIRWQLVGARAHFRRLWHARQGTRNRRAQKGEATL